jgi:hypothetical protein
VAGVLGLAIAGSIGAVEVGQSPTGAVAYMNGGITADEADTMRAEGRRFPLQLEFAASADGRNPYVADVNVRIVDAAGQVVMNLPNKGPILLANLAPGRYTVYAEWQGDVKSRAVDVGSGHTKVGFTW